MIENSQSRLCIGDRPARDKLSALLPGCLFRILKGIQSDILADGSLDYAENVLERFDSWSRASMAGSN
jgi:hypothetical protein